MPSAEGEGGGGLGNGGGGLGKGGGGEGDGGGGLGEGGGEGEGGGGEGEGGGGKGDGLDTLQMRCPRVPFDAAFLPKCTLPLPLLPFQLPTPSKQYGT